MSDKSGRRDPLSLAARLVHGTARQRRESVAGPVVPPLYASSNYRFSSLEQGARAFAAFSHRASGHPEEPGAWVYDRWDEPGRRALEERLADAAGGSSALTFSSGMAAIAALAAVAVPPGGAVVTQRPIYGGTQKLLQDHLARRQQVRVRFVEDPKAETLAEAVDQDTALVFLESPANPDLTLVDLAASCRAVREAGNRRPPLVAVDNTFASPWCQRPLELGVDIAVESLTKFVAGFGTTMGGALFAAEDRAELMGEILGFRAEGGASPSPWASWQMLVYGLPTLGLRVARQQETAQRLAEHLEAVEGLEVRYPGLESHPQHSVARAQMRDPEGTFAPGGMLYFRFAGEDPETLAARFLDHLAGAGGAVSLAASLGQLGTLVESPTLMSHSEATGGAPPDAGGIRVSVGIEPFEDLRREFDQALDAALG